MASWASGLLVSATIRATENEEQRSVEEWPGFGDWVPDYGRGEEAGRGSNGGDSNVIG